jgi:cell division protein FtsI/penicillin-binding protein 2
MKSTKEFPAFLNKRLDKRRIFLALIGVMAGFLLVLGRLFWIQVFAAGDYSSRGIDLVANSVDQRQKGIVLDSGRGDFYDKDGKPLTGRTVKALAVFPVRPEFAGDDARIAKLCGILGIKPERWETFVRGMKEPQLWRAERDADPYALTDSQARAIGALELPGIMVLDYRIRYPENSLARQLIGFVGQNPEWIQSHYAEQLANGKITLRTPVGESGLEHTFDSLLRGLGPTSISFFTDAAKRPLKGLDVRMVSPQNPYYPLKVMTTLDSGIQAGIEDLLDRLQVRQGAVVVLDAENADVTAMASRPQLDRRHIRPEAENWANQALKALTPGSVFKTAVAAAALEAGAVRPDEHFECSGELGKYGFSCWKQGGHGSITLEEAFADSCNIAFAEVMKRLTPEQLREAAGKLGLTRPVGWTGEVLEWSGFRQFDAEEAGRVFARDSAVDEGALIQTAIGQRDVLLSPLQAANMVVTLLHGGEVRSPRAVKEIRYRNGRLMIDFPEKTLRSRKEGISGNTAATLLKWMREVVSEGTGKPLQGTLWPVAGKSGTAQVRTGTNPTVHQWFVGYGPVPSPRYAVAVVAENMPADGKNVSLRLFREVMDLLARREGTNRT